MASYIVNVSPKGQITIPKMERSKCKYNKYLLETKGSTIILKPIEIKVIGDSGTGLKDFSSLAESSFEFWDNPDDDVYSDFYKN